MPLALYRVVTIPQRDRDGWLLGTKTVKADWHCPTCGREMGTPRWWSFCEDGEWYSIHVWENKCGHTTKYNSLTIIDSK